ncbi:urease accessory protein UreD [Nonomuraea sp. NPDC003214]
MTLTAATARRAGRPGPGVHATARIRAVRAGTVTALPVLAGDGPFDLRRGRSDGSQARVCVIGAMSAPLGGDRLRIEVGVEEDAHLRVTSAGATVALRGPTSGHAAYDVRVSVAAGASLQWLPEPLISAARSNLRQTCVVDLAATARLVLREEHVLGRVGEPPGRLSARLTVRRGGRPLLDLESRYGPDAPGWDGPAVLAGHRTAGQILVVDPGLDGRAPAVRLAGDDPGEGQAVLTPLAGPAFLVSGVAPDLVRLRRLLDAVSRIA